MPGFRFKRAPERRGFLDLHGHGKFAALQAAQDKLDDATSAGEKKVTLVTGKGLHSPNRKPVIRPALDAYLSRQCYWRAPESNGGRITVLLDAPLDR